MANKSASREPAQLAGAASPGSLPPDAVPPTNPGFPDMDSKTLRSGLDGSVKVWSLRLLTGFLWALIAATWPLWTGQSDFPQVPLVLGIRVSGLADQLVLICFLFGTACTLTVPLFLADRRWHRLTLALTLLPAVLLILINQHRLQPWFWLYLLFLTAFLLLPVRSAVSVARANIAAMYLFSALSRCSPDMDAGMSGAIAATLLDLIGLGRAAQDAAALRAAGWLFVVAELMTAFGLMWRGTRRMATVSAMVLHAGLLIALGPVGLQHDVGVLLWNTMLLLLVPLLFSDFGLRRRLQPKNELGTQPVVAPIGSSHSWQATCLLIFAFAFPASGLFGIADNWPSWQLYSSRPEVYRLLLRPAVIDSLPISLQPFVSPPDPVNDLCFVRLDRWSLQQTGAPMYPEDRFQLDVIRQVTAAISDKSQGRLLVDYPQPLRWWLRTSLVVETLP